ncbi:MAG: ribonuclease HII [Glaciecola sp.]|jgi:ribonuclease HII
MPSNEKPRPRILAGIDEAGLGPMFGPLTLGLAAFRVPQDTEALDAADLWRALQEAVAPKPARGEERLVVADSKVVFQRTAPGWKRLESTALTFLRLAHPDAPSELWSYLTPGLAQPTAPWYAHIPAPLPAQVESKLMDEHGQRLQKSLDAHGIQLVEACLSVLPASDLNLSFEATQSKSQTVWIQTAKLIALVYEAHGHEGLHLIVDRQGARKHYAPLLQRDFPGHRVQRLQENNLRSDYWVEGPSGTMEISFQVGAEEQSLPTALASCFAKYARELSMHGFNRFFGDQQEGLKATAGYVTDGRRWMAEAKSLLEKQTLAARSLVRER